MKPAKVLVLLAALLVVCFQPVFAGYDSQPAGYASGGSNASQPGGEQLDLTGFEQDLESIRNSLKIPGMSVAVVGDQQLLWAQGFGYADLGQRIAATGRTPYHLASVTKPIAATLVMQLVEDGLLSLDDPVQQYGVELESDGQVLVKHLLNHTSQGTPGEMHQYDGNRYAMLGEVIERATGEPYAKLLFERILQPVGMVNAATNPFPSWDDNPTAGWEGFKALLGVGRGYSQFPNVYQSIARPYQFDETFNLIDGSYPLASNPAAGLIASVEDLARFDIALDRAELLPEARKQQMFTPTVSTFEDSGSLQYGLGWYVQDTNGTQFLWHAGRWAPSVSALYLKVPDVDMTFIALANSDNLSTPYDCLANGDVLCSTLALSFYSNLVFPLLTGKTVPLIDWRAGRDELVEQLREIEDPDIRELLERELLSYRQVFSSVGEIPAAGQLEIVHRMVFGLTSIGKTSYLRSLNRVSPEPVPAGTGAWEYLPAYRAGLAWFLVTGLSLIVLVWHLVRVNRTGFWMSLLWFLVVLVLGPLGLAGYLVSGRFLDDQDRAGRVPPPWKTALALTLFRVVAYSLWVALGIQVLLYALPEPDPLIIIGVVYLIPLLVGVFIFNRGVMGSQPGSEYLSNARHTVLVKLASVSRMFLGLVPVMILLTITWFPGNAALLNPLFALVLSLSALICALVNYPFNVWFVRAGYLIRGEITITPVMKQDHVDLSELNNIEPA